MNAITMSDNMLPIEVDESCQGNLSRSFWVQLAHDHLYLLLRQALLQFCGQIGQILLTDEALTVCIDFPEHSFEIFTGVSFVGFFEDHAQELLEVDVSTLILIVEGHGLIDAVALGMVALVLGHSLQEVSRGKDAVLVGVEGVEDLLPDLDLPLLHVVGHELTRLEVLSPGGAAHPRGVHRVAHSGVHHSFENDCYQREGVRNQPEKKQKRIPSAPHQTILQFKMHLFCEQNQHAINQC